MWLGEPCIGLAENWIRNNFVVFLELSCSRQGTRYLYYCFQVTIDPNYMEEHGHRCVTYGKICIDKLRMPKLNMKLNYAHVQNIFETMLELS